MKKLLAILISLCMVSAFAVPVFADANSDYIAAFAWDCPITSAKSSR